MPPSPSSARVLDAASKPFPPLPVRGFSTGMVSKVGQKAKPQRAAHARVLLYVDARHQKIAGFAASDQAQRDDGRAAHFGFLITQRRLEERYRLLPAQLRQHESRGLAHDRLPVCKGFPF